MNGNLAKATLSCDEPAGRVEFTFNPENITFTRKSDSKERPTASPNSGFPGGSLGVIFSGVDMPIVKIGKCQLEGPKVKDDIETISRWMSPVSAGALGKALASAVSAVTGMNVANQAAKLPVVVFKWGSGFTYPCNVTRITAKFTRFDPKGNPTRAEIQSIELKWTPKLVLMTNPTSGGPAGRLSHVLTSGESIPSLAQNRYGQPGYWRALADANGIDDPLRVAPGQLVYLPTTEELIRAAKG